MKSQEDMVRKILNKMNTRPSKSPPKHKKESSIPIYTNPERITNIYKRRLQAQYNEWQKMENFGKKVTNTVYIAPVNAKKSKTSRRALQYKNFKRNNKSEVRFCQDVEEIVDIDSRYNAKAFEEEENI
jgi:hypothetical protein